jgi:hypothetical protein
MRVGVITKSIAVVFIMALVLAVVALPSACSESGSKATVSLAIDRDIKQGDMFAVEVRIDTKTACRGAQCVLSFDPALMRCDEVIEGGFFKDWASANGGSTLLMPLSPSIDNNQGRVPATGAAGIAVLGCGQEGVKGEGVLLSYHFTALADGTASPTLSEVVLIDVTGNAIPEVEVNN